MPENNELPPDVLNAVRRKFGMKLKITLPPDMTGWLIDYKILGTDEDITPEEKALLLLRSALTPEPDISDDKIPQ